jgi:BCD family chlorophyll transporter-like MFS transporter
MRMGLWGAAQAIAFGMGGLMGATIADLARLVTGQPAFAFGLVFAIEAVMFVAAAIIASRLTAAAAIRPLEAGEAALMAAE